MKRKPHVSHFAAAAMAALSFVLPVAVQAEAYISATAGSGPDGYRSTEVRGNADLPRTPLSVNLLGFKSDSSSSDAISQSALGLDWKISELATAGLTHNRQDNNLIDISGNTVNLSFALDTLWHGELQTQLDLKRSASAYQFNNLPAAVQNNTINQTANSIGLSQDIVSSLTLYAAHDQFTYDHDPKQAAIHMMRIAPRRFFSTTSTLLAFPDTTNTFGITWRPLEPLTLDLSSSKTQTQTDQELKTRRLGIDYQLTDHLSITAAVSRASSTAIVTKQAIFPNIPSLTIPAGTTIAPATDDVYREFGLGWTF